MSHYNDFQCMHCNLCRRETLEFGCPGAKLRAGQLRPVSWWDKYGNDVPRLQKLAIRILSQDCTAVACERNWSMFSLVHTKRRNRLSTAQLERLVFVQANLRLLKKFSETREPIQVNYTMNFEVSTSFKSPDSSLRFQNSKLKF